MTHFEELPKESLQSPEEKERAFEKYVDKGIEHALAIIIEKFERAEKERNNLEFHNTAHTKDVIRRAQLILSEIQKIAPELVTSRDIKIGMLASAFHDTVQNYEENPEGGRIIRKRFVGNNEKASADLAVEFMENANKEAGKEIFSPEDAQILREAIDATVPGPLEKGTVIQPNLKKESSVTTRALALADLGTAGIDGPKRFLEEGDALFREENLDIKDVSKNPAILTEEKKESFKKRMLGWSRFQPIFAGGRKTLLESELGGLPERVREHLTKNIFTQFDSSIEAAKKRAEEREKMTFEALLRDMRFRR